jgi:hypothetical protein
LKLWLAAIWLALVVPASAGTQDTPSEKLSAAEARRAFAADICAEMSAQSQANGIPENFMARLIWKESLFDPQAVSPKGAQGIAQFMPGTAKLRGLDDPFEPKSALAASAKYLAELRQNFGNLGFAAAAYNAGEERVRQWLAGNSGLPYETQDYVLSITGKTHDDWKAEGAAYDIPALGKKGTFPEQCVSLVTRELSPQETPGPRGKWKPWGVVLSGGFSEARALKAFATIRSRYAIIKSEEPLVLRKRNLSMGRRKMVQVMVGRDSRAEAEKLCSQITGLGGACLVEKN